MKMRTIPVVCYEVTQVEALDPIRLYVQDLGSGIGRLVVNCYGEAWSTVWTGMGDEVSTVAFVAGLDADYLLDKLWTGATPAKPRKAYLRRICVAVIEACQSIHAGGAEP